MSWGHAISSDLVTWAHLPVALWPNNTYDSSGVFSGSITVVDGAPVISYTCVGPQGELQCLAYPANLSDPLLVEWIKDASNPVIPAFPPGTQGGNFRDDTTAWFDQDAQVWLMAIGNEQPNNDGVVQLYQSPDFKTWNYSNALYTLSGGGMIECPDFFSIAGTSLYALKMSNGPDSYFVGTYDSQTRVFTPTGPRTRLDYGQGYASKSFYDPIGKHALRNHTLLGIGHVADFPLAGKRQILWTWVAEEDNNGASRGWQSTQSLPREMTFDPPTQLLKIAPLPELQNLRNATLATLSNFPLPNGYAALIPSANGLMVEIDAYFYIPANVSALIGGGFGVSVRATPDLDTQTRIVLSYAEGGVINNNTDRPGLDGYIFDMDPSNPEPQNVNACLQACSSNASCAAWVYVRPGAGDCRCCLKYGIPAADPNSYCVSGLRNSSYQVVVDRSQSGTDGDASPQGGAVPYFTNSDGSIVTRLHTFVDHSIIEAFVDGGRARVTSRIYPNSTAATGIGLFSNATGIIVLNATVWSLNTIW
jgi:sucrose-6-phosphate hydrolase SacC (GH32 family)